MKGDILLDYAEFRLSQSRTRCELFVSAEGVTEKLASGFLKPFLTHLRIAEEQASRGLQNIRLECNPTQDNAWFTKGTIERFVRFVSTPEVLEQVKTIEDELIQLDFVHKMQIGERPAHRDGAISKNDSKSRTAKPQEMNGAQIMSRRHHFDIGNDEGDASKRELLRAMNVRLLALQQEQKKAFSRAAAAGFDRDSVADLMAFAENFGANRLHKVCTDFLTLFRKKHGANSEVEEGDSSTGEVSSSDSDMSLESGTGAELPGELDAISFGEAGNSHQITYGSCEETWESDTGERFISGPILKKQQNHTHGTRGWNSIEGRKACTQSENPYVNQHGHHPVTSKGPKTTSAHKTEFIEQRSRENYSQVESRINNPQYASSNSKPVYSSSDQGYSSSKSQLQNETNLKEESLFSQLRDMAQKEEARRAEGLREKNCSMSAGAFTCKETQPENSENLDRACKNQEAAHFPSQTSIKSSQQPLEGWAEPCDSDRSVTVHADTSSESFCKIPSSPKRSASPYLKSQTGSCGLKHQGSSDLRVSNPTFQEHCTHDSLRDQDSDCSASYAKDHGSSNLGADNNNLQTGSSTEPVRRLSVQAAISLFESKRKDSSDLPIKRLTKQESGKGSVESGNSSIPRKSVLRRWSGANELASELSSQQSRDSGAENQVATSKVQPDVCKPSDEDRASASTDETHDGLAQERSESKLSVIHLGDFREPITNVSSTFNISLQEHILGPETQPSLETSDGDFQWKQQRDLCKPSSLGDWGKQTKSEPAKCLTKEVKSNDSETVFTSKFEDDNAEAKKNISKGKIMRMTEAGQTNLSQSINTGESGLEQGKTSIFGDASETSSKNAQGNLVVRTSCKLLKQQSDIGSQTTSQSTLSNNMSKSVVVETSSITQRQVEEHLQKTVQSVNEVEPKVLSVQKLQTSRVTERSKEKTSIGAAGHSNITSKIKHKGGKESSGSSRDNTSLDINLQALADIVDRRHNNQVILQGDGSCDTQRGKLYEHYNKLRDAKLRQEHVSKRAEREAKLKALAETLDRSKAEMKSRTPRMSRKNSVLPQAQASIKSESLKSSLVTRHKKQEGEEEEETDQDEYQLHIQGPTNSSPTSPPLTPHAGNGVLVSKPHAVKKSTSQKSATTPSSSSRVPNSLSPSMPKNPAANPSGPWRSAALTNQASIDENPLARSAPSFADLRKENAKPSSGRTSGSRVHSKNNNRVGRQRVDTEATTPSEAGGNASVLSSNKEDTRNTSVLIRKSCATIADLRPLSDQGQEDELLASLDVQKEGTAEPALYSKIRRSAVTPIQEAKPFLRKGQGIGPGAGPGLMKLKAPAMTDDTKSSDEETPLSPTLNAEDVPQKDVIEVSGSINSGAGSEADIPVINEELLTGQLPPREETQPEATKVLTLDSPPDLSENDKLDHTVPFPDDSLQCKQENGASSVPLSQLLAQTAADSEHNAISFTASSSFRADSLQLERMVTPFSPTSSSLPQSGRISGRFSPPSVVALESPPESPVSWNSSQIPYISEVDVVHGRKNWGNPHRPLIAVTQHLPKEPAKGLKRLLKFGRKSRASETAATDWVSASTTSEGDDDPDEARDLGSADDLLRRAKMQEKGFEFRNTNGHGDSYSNQDQGTIQSLRSSIPAPPAHFRLREDHLSGGTLLKAPRSFFSLSSFRSKGSEGKGR